MALGAERHHIYKLIVGQGATLVGIGTALGLACALGLGRLVSSMLFGVTSTDPVAYGSVLSLVVFVALLACFIPARRATKIDPMRALRTE